MQQTFKSTILLIVLSVLLFVSGSLQQNFDFADASTVSSLPSSIVMDNSLSPDDASLSLCAELSSATSFLWYKIDASSSLRTITVDTCDVTFDSVIGVFSGTSFGSLISLGCNDDRATASASCDSSSSLLENISITAGETIYIVVGSFKDPYTGLPTLGSGHLQITVIDQTTLQCTSDLILQVEQDLQLDISNLQSNITSSISSSTSTLATDIANTQTAITDAITASESALADDITAVQTTADAIKVVVDFTSGNLTSVSSLLSTVDSNVDTVHTDLVTVNSNVNTLGSNIDTLSSSVSSQFAVTNTSIDAVQSSADQIIVLSNQLLANSSAIQSTNTDIATQISSFETAVDVSFTTVDSDITAVNTQITSVNANIVIINDDIDTIEQSISNVGTKISTLSTDMNNDFDDTNTNIDAVQSSADQIILLVNQMLGNSSSIQTQQGDLASQLSAFESSVNTEFGGVVDALTTVNNAVASLSQTSQASFSDRASELTTLQSSSDSIQSDTAASRSMLNSMQANVNIDTNQAVFVDTLIRYLADKTIVNPPLIVRMPNSFGGRMNDAAAYVAAQYSTLKASALAVGSKTSTQCTSNAFCNYFLNTADAAYSDSIAKYNSYLGLKKFLTAYSYLQQAFINLYPSTW